MKRSVLLFLIFSCSLSLMSSTLVFAEAKKLPKKSSVVSEKTVKTAAAKAAPSGEKQKQPEKLVNINTASAEEIAELLTGIGPMKAQAIVDWRERNGKFTRIDQLLSIKGIGHKTLESNKGRIQL